MTALSEVFAKEREDKRLFPERVRFWESPHDRWRDFETSFGHLELYEKFMAYEWVVKEINRILKLYADRAPVLFEKVKESEVA